MINHLLLGACVAVVAIGLSAPATVSTSRGQMTQLQPRQVLASQTNTHVAAGTGQAEQTDETGFLGVVVALQSVELSAKFDGTLERLDVHVGDHVKGGTLIARLDGRSVAQDLAIAEASLLVAEAEHDRLAIELEDASDRRARLHSIPELFAREQLEACRIAGGSGGGTPAGLRRGTRRKAGADESAEADVARRPNRRTV